MRKITLILSLILGLLAGSTLHAAPASATPGVTYKFWEEATSGLAVNGTYRAVVGNFGGSAQDDIVWFAPGTASDSAWLSNNDTTFTKRTLSPQATFTDVRALVGDFAGDSHEDIFWYGPGTAPDSLWISNGDGTFAPSTIAVNGTYTATVLDSRTGKDDIIWARSGGGAGGSIWSFSGSIGFHTSSTIPTPVGATAVTGQFTADGCADVLWFTPDASADQVWTMGCYGTVDAITNQYVTGDYTPKVQQFSPSGDLLDDIAFTNTSGRTVLLESLGTGAFRATVHTLPAGEAIGAADVTGVLNVRTATGAHEMWFPLAPGVDHLGHLTNTAMDARYRAVVGSFVGSHDDIFWYAPGSAPERLFSTVR